VGGIAATHFPGWQASPDAEVIALSDPAGPVLERVPREQQVTLTYENPADLIDNPNIDIVDICTPNMYHASLAIAALEAGKHVLWLTRSSGLNQCLWRCTAFYRAGASLLIENGNIKGAATDPSSSAALHLQPPLS